MNVFVLDECPRRAAAMLCGQHVVALKEAVQLLSTAAPPGSNVPYAPYGVGMRLVRWLRGTPGAWGWLVAHGREVARLYRERAGRVHACEALLEQAAVFGDCEGASPECFQLVMPEELRALPTVLDEAPPWLAVKLYRAYYRRKGAEWAAEGRPMRWHGAAPGWFTRPHRQST